ncbi:hypothetical protein CTRI78_v011056 [Colletotrichum trifolii]|uniref:Uncharacterized protein n=1 Tax=Colletotrichum trifolii TaxID=5466 RepID=A0A4R8QFN6_COLTR|nr:hypothetical protein CTRI78_v011056 [Colletotrichum trifolii]
MSVSGSASSIIRKRRYTDTRNGRRQTAVDAGGRLVGHKVRGFKLFCIGLFHETWQGSCANEILHVVGARRRLFLTMASHRVLPSAKRLK